MSVIEMPVRKRIPVAVRSTPAEVVNMSRQEVMQEGLANLARIGALAEADREADQHMAMIHRELEMLVLKASALAKMHDRQDQARIMFDHAAARLKAALR